MILGREWNKQKNKVLNHMSFFQDKCISL